MVVRDNTPEIPTDFPDGMTKQRYLAAIRQAAGAMVRGATNDASRALREELGRFPEA